MANKYIKELSQLTQLASAYGIEIDTGTTSGYSTLDTLLTYNNRYKIVPSVSSNDLVLAIKTIDGNDASATDAIPFKIGNTIRWCTAALSVTKADGTNWANLGSAELGTKEQDLFAYVVWNTNTGAVDVFWSRIPYGSLYSDFSATTTNEKYAAINASAPASTDECVNIGRFAATLSLSGTSHLWTVPTFTNINLRHSPIYETRWLSWEPSPTGFSAVPTATVYVYRFVGTDIQLRYREGTNGTSNATTFTATAPFTALTVTNGNWNTQTNGVDNGTVLTVSSAIAITTGSNTLTMLKDFSGAAWTNANGKRIGYAELRYPVA